MISTPERKSKRKPNKRDDPAKEKQIHKIRSVGRPVRRSPSKITRNGTDGRRLVYFIRAITEINCDRLGFAGNTNKTCRFPSIELLRFRSARANRHRDFHERVSEIDFSDQIQLNRLQRERGEKACRRTFIKQNLTFYIQYPRIGEYNALKGGHKVLFMIFRAKDSEWKQEGRYVLIW